MRILRGPIVLLPVLLIACLFLVVGNAHAAEKKVLGDVIVEEEETVREARTVWGDVTVRGSVEEDVQTSVGDIRIEGPVGGNVEVGSGNIYVEDSVGGDVEVGSGEIYVNAPVGDDVNVGHGDVYLRSGAQVAGDISQQNGKLDLQPDAVVHGYRTTGMAPDFDDDSPVLAFSGVIGWAVMTLGLVAAAVLLAVAAPRPLRASARSLESGAGRSMIIGLISMMSVLVLSFLLIVTVVGIPLALLLLPAYLALVLFGALVVAYFLGRKVVLATGRYRAGDTLAAAVGAFLMAAIYEIPILGGLVFAALALLGTGAAVSALVASRSSSAPRPTYASYENYLREHP